MLDEKKNLKLLMPVLMCELEGLHQISLGNKIKKKKGCELKSSLFMFKGFKGVQVRGRRSRCFSELRRGYKVLALESSCDDSCVALLEKSDSSPQEGPKVLDHIKSTLNSQKTGGIVPTQAHEFHQQRIGNMVAEFCHKNGLYQSPPDLICCTRGPGMVGSLSASLQLAKGLAIAWDKPFIGVHHMLGHILASKLPSEQSNESSFKPPQYPFLSLLCSGGHTMLVLLKSLTNHEIIIDTCDIAVGDSLDKCARELGIKGNLLGKELEKYVNSIPPSLRSEFDKISTHTRDNDFKFKLKLPLRGPHHKAIPEDIEFTFALFLSTIQKYKETTPLDESTRAFISYKTQQLIFKHVIDRVNVSLIKHGIKGDGKFAGVKDLIFSGGVASNMVFRSMLQTDLKTNVLSDKNMNDSCFKFHFPDISLCTDNAIMIGVAGIEIFETLRKVSDLNILPLRKWPMNELLDVDGWIDYKG